MRAENRVVVTERGSEQGVYINREKKRERGGARERKRERAREREIPVSDVSVNTKESGGGDLHGCVYLQVC